MSSLLAAVRAAVFGAETTAKPRPKKPSAPPRASNAATKAAPHFARLSSMAIAAVPEKAIALLEDEFGALARLGLAPKGASAATYADGRVRAVFAASPALQREFRSVDAFMGYVEGMHRGRISVVGPAGGRS